MKLSENETELVYQAVAIVSELYSATDHRRKALLKLKERIERKWAEKEKQRKSEIQFRTNIALEMIPGTIANWCDTAKISYRTMNQLKPIYKKPLSYLVQIAKDEKLTSLKNIGRKTEQEIIEQMKIQGIL